ncbi:putative mitochondrial 18 KDa protein (MTP18) [Lyophyllum shimeji]|uniref:Mitochondrial fission process protein 1 n=1 Tax=Lyophyllum shimeji TaxID=47721 RepID=A0A9P3UJM7_LYOSH|nr:putative mitochondrial 18 KDa protein (MTP18) [Lyophyllum shimeji]
MPVTEVPLEAAKITVDDLADKNVDSADSNVRYLAYASRLRTALRAGHRYLAYTSDVGEAFRPVVSSWVVRAAYGVSWLYLAGDVAYESYKAHRRGPSPIEAANFSEPTRIALAAAQRATFQSIASMALPALTIHTTVAQSKKAFKNVRNVRIRAWGPTIAGLAIVPALPYIFDHPVEVATDRAFEWIKKKLIEAKQQPEHASKEKPEL